MAPETLYKYRIWTDFYQKKILTDHEIYLASVNQFNDPFDAILPIKYNDEDLKSDNLFTKLYSYFKTNHPNWTEEYIQNKCYERQMSGDFDNGAYWKSDYTEYQDEITQKSGIFCATTRKDNLLMWSHYANSHQGFCVGLDKEIIQNSTNGAFNKVDYSTKFPECDFLGDRVLNMMRLLHTKSKDWEYEEEYRLIKFENPSMSNRVYSLPIKAIKEVILGYRMPDNNKDEIVDLVKNKFKHTKIYQSQRDLEEFKLNMIPIL